MRRGCDHYQPRACLCSEAHCVPTAIKETKDALLNVNNTLRNLKRSTAQLNSSLSDIKTNLEQSLNDPLCSVPPVTATCNDIRMTLNQLDDNTNVDEVRRVTWFWGSATGPAGPG